MAALVVVFAGAFATFAGATFVGSAATAFLAGDFAGAFATFAGATGEGEPGSEGVDPAQPEERLLDLLDGALAEVTVWLSQRQVPLSAIVDSTGFQRNKAILNAKESINENDETRKRFELMARAVLARFALSPTVNCSASAGARTLPTPTLLSAVMIVSALRRPRLITR